VRQELHITRRSNWADHTSGPPITFDEFQRLMARDQRFAVDDELGLDMRTYTAKHKVGDSDAPFLAIHEDGDIISTDPPTDLVKIMVEISRRLDARVVNDFNEEFSEAGRIIRATSIATVKDDFAVMEVGGFDQYRFAWSEVARRGKSVEVERVCPGCKRDCGDSRRIPPVEVVLKQPRTVGDFVHADLADMVLVSDRFRQLYESGGFNGLSDWLPVKVRRQGSRGTDRYDPPRLWAVYFCTSSGRLDPNALGIQWMNEPETEWCPVCGPDGVEVRSIARFVVDPQARPSEDFFRFANLGQGYMASRRAVEAIREARLENVSFVPISRYAHRHF